MFFWMHDRKQNSEQNSEQSKEQNIEQKGENLLSIIRYIHFPLNALKRMSSCSPDKRSQRGQKASMTVEACFVLPFFLFAFLNIISIVEIYRLQGNLSAAMHDTAKQMALYGYEYRQIGGGSAGAAESLGLTYLYAAGKVRTKLGTAYLDNSPLAGGALSIVWLRSSVMQEDDCIDLIAEYRIGPPVTVVGYQQRILYSRMRTRAWTGYDSSLHSTYGGAAEKEIVYLTPDGSVYHRSRGCSYLKLSIVAVDRSVLETQRNQDGSKYYSCEECGDSCGSTVYITNYGSRYHSTLGCSGLKRTVMAVPISETCGRGACSKCG